MIVVKTSKVKGNYVESQVENWLTSIVIELNLCPFAQREYRKNSIRIKSSAAAMVQEVVRDLVVELSLLNKHDDIETTLLVLPNSLADFYEFNDFLGFADQLIDEMHFEGVFQIASFHPDYQFSGTEKDAAENFTNRSPYPILHLLRESSLDRAVKQHPDTSQIPLDNIELMNKLGSEHMLNLLQQCQTVHD